MYENIFIALSLRNCFLKSHTKTHFNIGLRVVINRYMALLGASYCLFWNLNKMTVYGIKCSVTFLNLIACAQS